jgi:hypothetical protein
MSCNTSEAISTSRQIPFISSRVDVRIVAGATSQGVRVGAADQHIGRIATGKHISTTVTDQEIRTHWSLIELVSSTSDCRQHTATCRLTGVIADQDV